MLLMVTRCARTEMEKGHMRTSMSSTLRGHRLTMYAVLEQIRRTQDSRPRDSGQGSLNEHNL
jgi:hypothetical protein